MVPVVLDEGGRLVHGGKKKHMAQMGSQACVGSVLPNS
jgi:hypothetical protein